MSVNQLLANFPTNTNFTVPTSNQGAVTFSVGGPPGGGAPPVTTTQQIWVAPWGSDTAGDGSEDKPFLTILHAQTVALVDAGPTKTYQIILYPGTFTENVALAAFVDVVGQIPSNSTQSFYPSRVTGNFTLGPSFAGALGQLTFVTNIDLDGTTTMDFTAVASNGLVSFTNVQTEDAVVINGGFAEYHNCQMFGNFTQTGGSVTFYNTNGVNGAALLLVQAGLPAVPAFFSGYGGAWQGSVEANQNGSDPGTPVALQSFSFSINHGNATLIASATDSPSMPANIGDLPANVALSGAAAALSPNMRVTHQFANITGAVAGTDVTTLDFPFPAGLFGVTPIENLAASAAAVGSNWGTIFGPHDALWNVRFETVTGTPTLRLVIANIGAGFNITDPLTLNYEGILAF